MKRTREEQRILAQLSVFRGGFGATAVSAITNASEATLESLHKKSLLTLQGIVTEISGVAGLIDQVMCLEFIRQFGQEWPERWFRRSDFRGYPTMLSNTDLVGALFGLPATSMRFWCGCTRDIFQAFG